MNKTFYKTQPFDKKTIDRVCEFAKTERNAYLIFYSAIRLGTSPEEIIKIIIRYKP